MTKSIQEQAGESLKLLKHIHAPNAFKSPNEVSSDVDYYQDCGICIGIDIGAKARDAQWLEVVSELREALDNIMTASQKSEESHALNVYYTAHDTLANTDQMLKEMNINKGE